MSRRLLLYCHCLCSLCRLVYFVENSARRDAPSLYCLEQIWTSKELELLLTFRLRRSTRKLLLPLRKQYCIRHPLSRKEGRPARIVWVCPPHSATQSERARQRPTFISVRSTSAADSTPLSDEAIGVLPATKRPPSERRCEVE